MSVRDESEDRSAHLDPVDHAQDLLVAALLADRAARCWSSRYCGL